ncbi:hypothetical protein ABZ682_23280 [Streptomyces griseoviridis]|uniref:hypothetical protein n=1 Tax=Streptomyces griseoviridis TaxID=45398 RepID=UPI0033DC0FBB
MSTQENRAAATALPRLDADAAGQVDAGWERRLATEQWLLDAADDEVKARQEWCAGDVALLRCGRSFSAIRVPLMLVQAAADSEAREQVAAYLHEALLGGAAFVARGARSVYCLIPASTPDKYRVPDCEHLRRDSYLGVPFPATPQSTRSYWLVKPAAPDSVSVFDSVAQMVTVGRSRAAMRAGG